MVGAVFHAAGLDGSSELGVAALHYRHRCGDSLALSVWLFTDPLCAYFGFP
jgi:hypothetical protein